MIVHTVFGIDRVESIPVSSSFISLERTCFNKEVDNEVFCLVDNKPYEKATNCFSVHIHGELGNKKYLYAVYTKRLQPGYAWLAQSAIVRVPVYQYTLFGLYRKLKQAKNNVAWTRATGIIKSNDKIITCIGNDIDTVIHKIEVYNSLDDTRIMLKE